MMTSLPGEVSFDNSIVFQWVTVQHWSLLSVQINQLLLQRLLLNKLTTKHYKMLLGNAAGIIKCPLLTSTTILIIFIKLTFFVNFYN